MKKKRKKLSLEKINIARLTTSMRYIYGGDRNEPSHTCTQNTTDTTTSDYCTTNPLNNSSLECVQVSATCDTHQEQINSN